MRCTCNGASKQGGEKIKQELAIVKQALSLAPSLSLSADSSPLKNSSSYLQPPQLGEEASPERDLESLGEVPGHEGEELEVEGLGEPARRSVRLQQVSTLNKIKKHRARNQRETRDGGVALSRVPS